MKNAEQAEEFSVRTINRKADQQFTVNTECRQLTVGNLDDIVRVHIEAFPESAWTKLGSRVVKNYYHWQITGPHPLVTAEAAYLGGDCAGFLVAGLFCGSTGGFISANRYLLAGKTLMKPWLLLNPEFRGSFQNGWRILKKQLRRNRAEPKRDVAENIVTKSYGILAIAVSPRFQGCGVGKMLMETAEKTAVLHGFEKMDLSVNPSNTQAVRFYKRLNWKKTTIGNGRWTGVMEKSLQKTI